MFANITFSNVTDPENVVGRTVLDPDFEEVFPFVTLDPNNLNSNLMPAVDVFADERYLGLYMLESSLCEVLTFERFCIFNNFYVKLTPDVADEATLDLRDDI